MSDFTDALAPKSDQLTADDLITGSMTVCITRVTVAKTEQPVSVSFEGDCGKPWKPCKTMGRVLATMWGPDTAQFIGRSLTLYRDPDVLWGGLKTGGIRISHMSHIQGKQTIALTVTRGSKKPFTVNPLMVKPPTSATTEEPKRTAKGFIDAVEVELNNADTAMDVAAIKGRTDVKEAFGFFKNGVLARLEGVFITAEARFAAPFEGADDLNDGIYGQPEEAA